MSKSNVSQAQAAVAEMAANTERLQVAVVDAQSQATQLRDIATQAILSLGNRLEAGDAAQLEDNTRRLLNVDLAQLTIAKRAEAQAADKLTGQMQLDSFRGSVGASVYSVNRTGDTNVAEEGADATSILNQTIKV